MLLATERMKLERARNSGWLFVVIGALNIAGAVNFGLQSASRGEWAVVVAIAVGVVAVCLIVFGITRIVAGQAALRRFEDEHGVDAGKQRPVT